MTGKIEIEDIKRLNVKPGDRVIFTVEVGNMPQNRVQKYFDRIKEELRGFLPSDVQILVVPPKVKVEVVSANRTLEETHW